MKSCLRLREREVDNRLNISEAEVDNYLTTQSSSGQIQDEFELSHILIRVPKMRHRKPAETAQQSRTSA